MGEICPVCESTNTELMGNYRYQHPTFSGMKRANCRNCGLVFAAPMPLKSNLVEYNANYFDTAHGSPAKDNNTAAFFSGIARLRFDHLERYLKSNNIRPRSVLEIGPGRGFFARAWLDRLSDTRYWAIEPDRSCHEDLLKCGVRIIDSSQMVDTAISADVLVMSHVLEHVDEPAVYLNELSRNLKPGGAIFIEVPCGDWQHKSLDEPHLLFFEKNSLTKLLQATGFERLELSFHGIEIERLKSRPFLREKWLGIRGKLIAFGFVAPFSRVRPGMAALSSPLERAMVAPFEAHRETSRPAWWLRALAVKAA